MRIGSDMTGNTEQGSTVLSSPGDERTRAQPEVHHKVHAEHVFVIIGVPANVNSEFR